MAAVAAAGSVALRVSSVSTLRPSKSKKQKAGSRQLPVRACKAEEPCSSQGEPAGVSRRALFSGAAALAAAASVATSLPAEASPAFAPNQAIPDLGVLIAGAPQKDARALLRLALPITNKPIREIQEELESITESLKGAGIGFGGADRSVRKSLSLLKSARNTILADVAPAKKNEASQSLDALTQSCQNLLSVLETKNKEKVLAAQNQALLIVGSIEDDMVKGAPFEVPPQYVNMPILKGRATMEMVLRLNSNPENPGTKATLTIIVDGYNAPLTAGNFVDLVEKHFYDGMEIQRSDGFVVQTGKPDGDAEGYVDPKSGSMRTIPLEFAVRGDKELIYSDTLEDLGRYKAQPILPFNAFGTMAMAREEFNNDSASSQFFWLLKESELTPTGANILDGRYAVFGYIVDNADVLASVRVGDVIESVKVLDGAENLVNKT
eukprot:jgi/Chlat1/4272/Chrsp29S04375